MPERDDPGRDLLAELAAAVADRTPPDWDAERVRSPEFGPALDRLREVAALESALATLRARPVPPGSFRWGGLDVFEKLGEGSFAEVFRARDPALDREVALKLRRSDAAGAVSRRWLEEARRLARVSHPNVLAVYGADAHDGRAGIWTECLHGRTLEDTLADRGPLGPREAVALGIDLCGALAAVHAAGLVHGDITTRNVMREGAAGASDRSGRIVLMDFGSAHEAATGRLIAFGTPLYTAPEILEGGAASVATDVYALGVVLYRMLTGAYPIEAPSVDELRRRLAAGERTPLRARRPELPSALVQAIERAFEPDPDRRHAGAAAFERALTAALTPPAVANAPTRRSRLPLALGAGVAVAAAIAWVVLTRGRPSTIAPAVSGAPSPGVTAQSPAPPAPPPVAGVPEVDATLVRVTAGSHEALRTGDLVVPGDELALEFQSPVSLHAYVLTEDETGAIFVLFPLAGSGIANPLAPGVPHRLPGRSAGADLSWQVTSAGGRETFLLLASPTPLVAVIEAIGGIPRPRSGEAVTYPALPPEALSRLRGVGGVTRASSMPAAPGGGRLERLAHDLTRSPEARSLWMRLVVLENPRP